MLNLSRVIKYSRKEKKHFKFLKKKYGGNFTGDTWYDGMTKTKTIKNRLSNILHTKQKFRCVYCEKFLIRESKEIDHITPISLNPEFTFTCINLAYSCGYCNSTLKNQKPVISNINNLQKNYKNNTYLIVHPYLDDPDLHIKYHDNDKIYLDLNSCSTKGKKTIEMFDLDGTEMQFYRAGELKLQKEFPIHDDNLKLLILEAVSYKK